MIVVLVDEVEGATEELGGMDAEKDGIDPCCEE